MLLGACLVLTAGAADETGKAESDQQFVMKASPAGLGEGNLGGIAAKQAGDPAVKEFGQHMVKDHTKANAELIRLADKKKLKVAAEMDEKHKMLGDKLLKLSGAKFDREYMHSQVKDHKEAVSLFEKESKEGKDADLKQWAKKTLPTLREHFKMAKEIHGKMKGDKEAKEGKNKSTKEKTP